MAWKTEDGLDIPHGKIVDAAFEIDAEYRDGEVPRLILTIEDMADGHQIEQRYGTGKGWDLDDDEGTGVSHNTFGKEKGFHPLTGVGRLIDALVELGYGEELADRGEPTDAAAWIGSEAKWENVEFSMSRDGEDITYSVFLPTERIEAAKPKKAPARAASKAPASKAPAKKAPAKKAVAKKAPAAPEVELPDGLIELAAECTDHSEFVERAFNEFEGVESDAELAELVMTADVWTFGGEA